MAPRVDPVASDESLPDRADVVVIGGGIIGPTTALFLAQKGVSVAACGKGHIAGEKSSRNWGAVRGIETAAGRVAGVVTEKGRIACGSVVLAGGAWSRLFCGNLGIELPQLKVLASVMRTERLDGGPEISATGGRFGYRKRLDGGYTVSTLGVRTVDIVPDSFRLFPQYLPTVRVHWKKLRFRLGHRFIEEWRVARERGLDQASPLQAVRGLDPPPHPPGVNRALCGLSDSFPLFLAPAS